MAEDRIIKFSTTKQEKTVFNTKGQVQERNIILNDFAFKKFISEYIEDCIPQSLLFMVDDNEFEISHKRHTNKNVYIGNKRNKKSFGIGCSIVNNSKRIGYFVNDNQNLGFFVNIHDNLCIFDMGEKGQVSGQKIVYNNLTNVFFEECKISDGRSNELSRGIGFPFKYIESMFEFRLDQHLIFGTSSQNLDFSLEIRNFCPDAFLNQIGLFLGGRNINREVVKNATPDEPDDKINSHMSYLMNERSYGMTKYSDSILNDKLRLNKLFTKREFLYSPSTKRKPIPHSSIKQCRSQEIRAQSKIGSYSEIADKKAGSKKVKHHIEPLIMTKDRHGKISIFTYDLQLGN